MASFSPPNAAVSETAASAYRAALNHLIQHNSRRLSTTKIVFWYKHGVGPKTMSSKCSWAPGHEEGIAEQGARKLLASIEAGERPDLRDNYFYALTLSGASGRVMVHDWMEGRFEELVRNVNRWYDDLEIVRADGNGTAWTPRLYTLLVSLVRELNEKSRDEVAAIETGLWRSALRCKTPIPGAAMAKALAASGSTSSIPNDRSAQPAWDCSKRSSFAVKKEIAPWSPISTKTIPLRRTTAGRLMAMLAALQHRAQGDVGAGVVQRYYASASSTPALVLGRLMRTAQFHLDKLDRGLARWHEGTNRRHLGRIREDIPTTLDLEGQTLFALGYYQQIATDRSRTRQSSTDGDCP